MVLSFAVVLGLLAGSIRARWGQRPLALPSLRRTWLVLVAFSLQLFVFHRPIASASAGDRLAPFCLISSISLLVLFVYYNRDQPGSWMLGLGLLLNLSVIVLNGGWMPISPETVTRLAPNAPANSWQVGSRLWSGKDVVLPKETTRLWPLSDWLLLPKWFSYQIAFSPGDVVIASGVFWLLWSMGGRASLTEVRRPLATQALITEE